MNLEKEIRALSEANELRAVQTDGAIKISGLAIPYNTKSSDLGGFFEVAAPGLVTRSLREQPSVLALRDHDPSKLLGSTDAQTLILRDTPAGLAFDVTLPDTEVGRDTYTNVKLGNLRGVSFGFQMKKDSWSQVDGKTVRTLHDISLHEISPCSFPAYSNGTSVSVRTCPAEYRSLLTIADDQEEQDFQRYVALQLALHRR